MDRFRYRGPKRVEGGKSRRLPVVWVVNRLSRYIELSAEASYERIRSFHLAIGRCCGLAVGANCGSIDPTQMAAIVSALRSETTLPVLAQSNAGKPRLVNDKTVFEMAPAAFAAGVTECIRAGATIVGGCCGTTPQHMRAVAEALKER